MTGQPTQATGIEEKSGSLYAPFKVLEYIVNNKLSGCFTFRDPSQTSETWQLYIGGGQLNYATSVTGKADRLRCLLYRTQPLLANLAFEDEALEYVLLIQWWHRQKLPVAGLRQLLLRLSSEALVQILSIPQATIEFQKSSKIEPLLIGNPLDKVPSPLIQSAMFWKQWRRNQLSPLTVLTLNPDYASLFQSLWQQYQHQSPMRSGLLYDPGQLPYVIQVLSQNHRLYRLSQLLDVNLQTLLDWLQPFLQQKLVFPLTPPNSDRASLLPAPEQGDRQPPVNVECHPVIACIDDSKTVQRQVRSILGAAGYNVLSILEPTQALTSLVRQKPSLILMDVNMPDIDGYELCSMLRQSKQLRDIPVMMLTGRDGILDRVKAKMLGASQYLTKPFKAERLLECVEKLLETSPIKDTER